MTSLFFSILVNIIIAFIVWKKNILNRLGIGIAFLLGTEISFFCIRAYVYLIIYFVTVVMVEHILEQKEKRKGNQVICNAFFSVVAFNIWIITRSDKYILVYACLLAGSLADTMASTWGKRYGKKTVTIIGLKKQQKGLSGGISFIGTFCSLLFSVYMAFIYAVLFWNQLPSALCRRSVIVLGTAFLTMFIDSVLGYFLQEKYRCERCGNIVEERMHCNSEGKLIRGIAKCSNNVVNLLSSFITFIVVLCVLE